MAAARCFKIWSIIFANHLKNVSLIYKNINKNTREAAQISVDKTLMLK